MHSRKAVLRQHQEYGLSVPEIVDKHSEWVSKDTYMILKKVEMKTFATRDNRTNTLLRFSSPIKSEIFAIKCSKRGNDVYRHRVYRRFKELPLIDKDLVFFNPKDRGEKKTKALWVTLTYDNKRCSFTKAWFNIGKEFNRFRSYICKKFGKVSTCRVFEAYENGHPHIHCILLFEEKEFKAFTDQKGKFRIHEKEIIAKGWHSFVDVQAMCSLGWGFAYLKKYLLKSIDKENKDSKALKTLALGWLFNKRAFSVSGKFRQMLTDLIKTKHNSNHKTQQITLEREIVQEYVYFLLGFVPSDVVRLKNDGWFTKLNDEQVKSVEKFLESKKFSYC